MSAIATRVNGSAAPQTLLRSVPATRSTADGAATPAIAVLVADGHSLVRAGLRLLLESAGEISVVAEASSSEEAVAAVDRLRPDVVLIDATLPGLDSVESICQFSAKSEVAVMLPTEFEDDEHLLAALRAGATGLLLKDTEPGELMRAIEALARGEAALSPIVARRVIGELASRPAPVFADTHPVNELTPREREVVALVGHGLGNAEIAERLVVTLATAKTHVNRAMVKLHAHDRAKLVIFAYETGLVRPRMRRATQPDRLPDFLHPHLSPN